MSRTVTYYKVIRPDNRAAFNPQFDYSAYLPVSSTEPGSWLPTFLEEDLCMCETGYHLTTDPGYWINEFDEDFTWNDNTKEGGEPRIFEVEIKDLFPETGYDRVREQLGPKTLVSTFRFVREVTGDEYRSLVVRGEEARRDRLNKE